MSHATGRHVHYELMTTDPEGARAFYGNVIGWGAKDAAMPGMEYWLFTNGDTPAHGLMKLPDEARNMGAPPMWTGYVEVPDVDAAVATVRRLGGAVFMEPTDIPGIGRFANVADPQGAAFAVFHSAKDDGAELPDIRAHGQVGWNELCANDAVAVYPFYAEVCGWTKVEAMDMGAMGTYQTFAAGGTMIGGMMNKPPMAPVPFWQMYFNVGDIDAATEAVKANGGQVLNGPMQVPGGGWVINCLDPQGAIFALVGSRKA